MKNISMRKRLTACAMGVTMLLSCLPMGVSAEMTNEAAQAIIDKHLAEYKELTPLIEKCKSKGIQVKYEESGYAILGQFSKYMADNLSRGDIANVEWQDEELTEIYETTKAKLISYLDGTATPLSVPSYVTSDVSAVGKHFEATVENNGILEQAPVFFVGAGHWAPSRKEIPVLSQIGFNTMQPELGPSQFMSKETFPIFNWSERVWGDYSVNCSIETSEKRTGNQALKIVSTTPHKENNYWYMQQTVQVKPNTTYEYGVWAKAEPGKVAGTWFTAEPSWSGDGFRKWLNEDCTDWKQFNKEYTTGANEYTITFVICIEKPTEVLFDDAYVKEKNSSNELIGENLLLNGGFEKTERDDSAYWAIDEGQLNGLAKDFDLMAQHNIAGILNTAPHLVPQNFYKDYPEAMSPDTAYFSSRTNLDHPKTKFMNETYYRAVMPALAGKPAFKGIILMNEPEYRTFKAWEFYRPVFQEEMKKKYNNDIAALNANWGTEYNDFTEVRMPREVPLSLKQFYDWRVFNDQILPNYNYRASNIIKQYDKNIFTTTKMKQTMISDQIKLVDACNNWETMAPSVDINGCDAYTNYDRREGHNQQDYTIRAQDLFYDYQTSVKNSPVYNTEEHIFYFADQLGHSAEERAYNIAALWQGAVHGKGGSIIWFWDRTSASQVGGESYYSSLTERPGTVAAIGKMTMDLNRLAKEVVSITEAKANVGMLYSVDNTMYATDYMNTIYTAYGKLGENGQKTQFIATDTEESLNNLSGLKCLIVPHVVAVHNAGFNAVKNFADGGGKLIILGEDSLTKDEYGETRDAAAVNAVKEKATVVPIAATEENNKALTNASKASIGQAISSAVNGYGNVRIIDKATRQPLTDCEYLTSEYEGKTIINLCTYRDDDREIEIYLNDEKVNYFTDLISAEAYAGSAAAKAYTPMLLSIESNNRNQVIKELGHTEEVADVTYSSKEAYDGDWSIHVNHDSSGWFPIAKSCESFGMTESGKYDISFYFKGDIKTMYITAQALCVTNNKPWISGTNYPDVGQKVTGPDENGWYKFEVSDYTVPFQGRALLFIENYNGVNNFYLDRLSVIDRATGNELIQNGSFEPGGTPEAPKEKPIRKYTTNIKELLNDDYVRGVSYSAEEAQSGDWSVHVKGAENGKGISAKWLDFGLKHDKMYNVRFYLKGNVKRLYANIGNARIMFDANSPTEPKKNNSTDSLSPTGWATSSFDHVGNGWYYLNWTNAHTGASAGWIDNLPLFSIDPETDDNKGSGDFFIDGLSIKEVDADGNEGPELVLNGGFEPSAIEFSAYHVENGADGTATVKLQALNHSAGDNVTPQFVFAAYDDKNRLVSCTPMENATAVSQNKQWQPITYTIQTKPGEKVVAYIWDSLTNLKPLWQSETIIDGTN